VIVSALAPPVELLLTVIATLLEPPIVLLAVKDCETVLETLTADPEDIKYWIVIMLPAVKLLPITPSPK
jgi:hypothetical protein